VLKRLILLAVVMMVIINIIYTGDFVSISSEHLIPEMVKIEGGTFNMGSNNGGRDEKPVHSVKVNSFYMGKYELTNKEYSLYDPSHKNNGNNLPVVNISWKDAVNYCNWLSKKTGKNYRLPTEAEWEYACRAGTTTEYYWGNKIDGDYCWYGKNSKWEVHPVGQKKPNVFGLYDISGNVSEWCNDWHGNYPSGVINPTVPSTGIDRIIRGGSFESTADNCRSACRYGFVPTLKYTTLGFRIIRTQ
jgi:formylglycine-generating enzyme required for sulfatase activity